jgi:hypothetical protein
MAALTRRLVALSMVATMLTAGAARAVDGRYIGSVHRTDLGSRHVLEEFQRHQYDIGGRRSLPAHLDLALRANLQYQARLDVAGQGLMRGRLHADLRASTWRLGAQFVPWQDIAPGEPAARERDLRLSFDLHRARAPRLTAEFGRLDRDNLNGRSSSDDRRIQLAYETRGIGSQLGYRRIEGSSSGTVPFSTVTNEWRGGLTASRSWRTTSVQSSYEGLYSTSLQRERRRELNSHRVAAQATWNPRRRFGMATNLYERWGHSSDNAVPGDNDLSEFAADASAAYRPWDGVQFEALQQFRQRRTPTGYAITQYVQLEGAFRRDVRRGLALQAGYLGSQNLRSQAGELPNNSAYGLLDGRLRTGIEGRAELRASRAASGPSTGTQWQRLLQLRTRPNRVTRFEVTWRRDTLPKFLGIAQIDRHWDITSGWEPVPGTNLAVSWRWLDGRGRIERAERAVSLAGTWRVTRGSSLGVNWSRRNSTVFGDLTRETVTGADLTFWLPGQLEARGMWRDADGTGRPYTRSFGLSLQKNF